MVELDREASGNAATEPDAARPSKRCVGHEPPPASGILGFVRLDSWSNPEPGTVGLPITESFNAGIQQVLAIAQQHQDLGKRSRSVSSCCSACIGFTCKDRGISIMVCARG